MRKIDNYTELIAIEGSCVTNKNAYTMSRDFLLGLLWMLDLHSDELTQKLSTLMSEYSNHSKGIWNGYGGWSPFVERNFANIKAFVSYLDKTRQMSVNKDLSAVMHAELCKSNSQFCCSFERNVMIRDDLYVEGFVLSKSQLQEVYHHSWMERDNEILDASRFYANEMLYLKVFEFDFNAVNRSARRAKSPFPLSLQHELLEIIVVNFFALFVRIGMKIHMPPFGDLIPDVS